MMLTQIDHVVIVVRDLTAAMRDYTALGFTVTPGGTHAGGQTHNALVAFADGTYLELIAFISPDQPSPHYWYPRLAEGEGIEDFCLLADDLPADAAQWAASGLAVDGPSAGGRQRPDGVELRWQSVRFAQPAGDALLPFVIADETPRGLRVADGDATRHTVAGRAITRFMGVRIATDDLSAAMRAYIALLGVVPVGQDRTSAHFILGDQWIALHAPKQPDDAITQHLRRHGAGPYALVLGSAAPGQSAMLLDETLRHDAELWVE